MNGIHDQTGVREIELSDYSDWEDNSSEDSRDTEEETDMEQEGGNEGDILWLREILNRLRELKE